MMCPRIMNYLTHSRVVNLLGLVTLGEPAMIVEEFMANGNLHTFLLHVRLAILAM